jgi:hypothetical protein
MTASTGPANKDTSVGGARQFQVHKTWCISMSTRWTADKGRNGGLEETSKGGAKLVTLLVAVL